MKSEIRNWMRKAVADNDKEAMKNIPENLIKKIKEDLQKAKPKKKKVDNG